MKISLILADDHPALIAGIRYELSRIHTLDVVGTARNSTELVELLSRVSCDVLVTDYAMPGGEYGDGMTLLSFLRRRYPDLRIIVFTTIDNPALMLEMSKIGVRGVLNKVDEVGHLVSAIHAVHAGATYFSQTVQTGSIDAPLPRLEHGASAGELSRREAEVVRLYVSGMTINEIASELHRTKQTVSSHKTAAMRKLGIERDADLFRFAYETGLATAAETHTIPPLDPQQDSTPNDG